MKRLLVLAFGTVTLLVAAPDRAEARECGLPSTSPVWVDFADGSVPFWPMFARPGVVAAAANFIFPAQIRALGAQIEEGPATLFVSVEQEGRNDQLVAPFDDGSVKQKGWRRAVGLPIVKNRLVE